jgi:hypothetical protein
VTIFTWILSVQGELDETRWDKHFDMIIILSVQRILSAGDQTAFIVFAVSF